MAAKTKKTAIKKTVTKSKIVDIKPLSDGSETTKKSPRLRFSKKYLTLLGLLLVAGMLYLGRGLFIAATVNGYPISRFNVVRELEKLYGKQILENTVTKELINQEAKKKNISVSETDIDTQVEEIKKSLETQGTTLEAALSIQGQTVEILRDNIKLQKSAEQLLADKTSVSEEETKKYYDENRETFADKKYEDVKSQIETQLKAQKFQAEIEKYLTDLKAQYKINYFVSY